MYAHKQASLSPSFEYYQNHQKSVFQEEVRCIDGASEVYPKQETGHILWTPLKMSDLSTRTKFIHVVPLLPLHKTRDRLMLIDVKRDTCTSHQKKKKIKGCVVCTETSNGCSPGQ